MTPRYVSKRVHLILENRAGAQLDHAHQSKIQPIRAFGCFEGRTLPTAEQSGLLRICDARRSERQVRAKVSQSPESREENARCYCEEQDVWMCQVSARILPSHDDGRVLACRAAWRTHTDWWSWCKGYRVKSTLSVSTLTRNLVFALAPWSKCFCSET